MKKLKIKFADVLRNKKGEMLIETIISIMLFTFLIVGVTMIITSATNGIRTTQREADNVQQTANDFVTSSGLTPQSTEIKVVLEVGGAVPPTPATITQSGEILTQNDMIYFYATP